MRTDTNIDYKAGLMLANKKTLVIDKNSSDDALKFFEEHFTPYIDHGDNKGLVEAQERSLSYAASIVTNAKELPMKMVAKHLLHHSKQLAKIADFEQALEVLTNAENLLLPQTPQNSSLIIAIQNRALVYSNIATGNKGIKEQVRLGMENPEHAPIARDLARAVDSVEAI